MQENELEKGFAMKENEEEDIFESAEPDFDEEDAVMDIDSAEFDQKEIKEEVAKEDLKDEADEEDFDEAYKEETRTSKKGSNKKTSGFAEFCSFLLYIGAAVLITFFILHFVGQRTVVNGPSMMNTLMNGDNIILDKISYRFHEPERFDIIVFPVENEEKNYIKRIIGLPGETVQIVKGFIYITEEGGEPYELEESFGAQIMFDEEGNYQTTEPVKLGEDEYFVLGDNRNNSIDSRRIGPIERDIIVGRAWVRVYPFDTMGKIR